MSSNLENGSPRASTTSNPIFSTARHSEGYKSTTVRAVRVCPVCGEEYKRYVDEIEYEVRLGGKKYVLCSYNCKRRFMRDHEEEIEKEHQEDDGNYCDKKHRNRSPFRNAIIRRNLAKAKEKDSEQQ